MIHRITIISVLGFILYFLISCKQGLINPYSTSIADTTSNTFTSEVFILGNYGSWINGVSIINPDDYWVVGQFFKGDTFYNAIHWDGKSHNFKLIPTYLFTGDSAISELKAMYNFSTDNIWMVAATGSYTKGDGVNWSGRYIDQVRGSIYSLWGLTPDNLYLVGSNGSITWYNGSTFKLLDLPSNLDLMDIDGNQDLVFTVGYTDQGESGCYLLKNGNWFVILQSNSYSGDPVMKDYGRSTTVGVQGDTAYIVCKSGLVKYNLRNGSRNLVPAPDAQMLKQDYIDIDVVNWNDIILTGYEGHILHYNGKTWKKIYRSEDDFGSLQILFNSGEYKDNFFLAGGFSFDYEAVIIRLFRN